MSTRRFTLLHLVAAVATCLCAVLAVRVFAQEQGSRTPVSSAFTFQGRAALDGLPVDGTCDFRFKLFDAASTGSQSGPTLDRPAVPVANGLFSTQLDFGLSAFAGDARFVEVELRCPAGSGTYTLLPARQELTATPYALYAQQVPFSGIVGVPPGFGEGWQNVIVVAKAGGQFTSIQAAIDSISGASETNRFLVWVAPGIYEERTSIPRYVTVRGAGKDLATIRVVGGGSLANSTAVTMSDNSALESIRVEISGAAAETRVIDVDGSLTGTVEIRQVSILCLALGECVGLHATSTRIDAYDVEVYILFSTPGPPTGDGTAVKLSSSSTLTLDHFDLNVARGGSNANAYGLYSEDSVYRLANGTIRIVGQVSAIGLLRINGGGSNIIDHLDIFATATGSAIGAGIFNAGIFTAKDSRIDSFSYDSQSSAVYLSQAGALLESVELIADGEDRTAGIIFSNVTSPIVLNDVAIGDANFEPDNAIAGASNINASANVYVYDSLLYGDPAVVGVVAGQRFRISNSLVDGKSGGTFTCVASYNRSYVALGASC